MTWLNPWAWLGLAAIGAPIVAHLLARRTSVRLPFPTLRFIPASRLSPARRRRLTDRWMLALRVAIVIAAVAALAGPLVLISNRPETDTRVTVVIVDTSSSMQSVSDGRRSAGEIVREAAAAAARDADIARTIESSEPGRAVAEAARWLERRGGARQIAIVSDFQRGTIAARDIEAVPPAIGIRLITIPRRPSTAIVLPEWSRGGLRTRTRVTMSDAGVAADWDTAAATTPAARPHVRLFTADADRAAADAALTAALAVTPVDVSVERRIAVIFPGAPERDALLAAAAPITDPSMAAALVHVPDALAGPPTRFASVEIDGAPHLAVFAGSAPGTITSAALLSHLLDTTSAIASAELDPAAIAASNLERWQRPGTPAAAPTMDREGPSDARWLWLLVLGLMAIEWITRRRIDRARAAEEAEAAHARVA